jgi:flagellar biosynthesis/type III secretory pathway protein FliH
MRLKVVKRASDSRAIATGLGPLVSARRARAAELAREMLVDARRRADDIATAALADAERARESARETGRVDSERRWAEAAADLAARRTAAAGSIERNCIELAIAIARQVVAGELELSRTAVERIAERACADLRRDARLVLRISPADLGRAEAIVARLGARGPVDLEVDPALAAGECVAECAGVRVDATVDVQLEAIERRLLGDLPEPAQ